jgi:hypothetical protein
VDQWIKHPEIAMRLSPLTLGLLLWAGIGIAPAWSDKPDPEEMKVLADAGHIAVVFTSDEIRIIRDYYEKHGSEARGNGRKKGLPPGIAKNLERGKPLPPGIAKQVLPPNLQSRLPRVPEGYERVIVDGKVLLIEVATRVVRDILTDVLY